jgi:hypothetical protein
MTDIDVLVCRPISCRLSVIFLALILMSGWMLREGSFFIPIGRDSGEEFLHRPTMPEGKSRLQDKELRNIKTDLNAPNP